MRCAASNHALVSRTAGANAVPAAQDLDELALRLEVEAQLFCSQSRIRRLRLRDRIRRAHRVLDMGNPDTKVRRGADIGSWIARRVVDRRRDNFDHSIVRYDSRQRIGSQVRPDGKRTQTIRRFDATTALRKLLVVIEDVDHGAQISARHSRVVDPHGGVGRRRGVVGKIVDSENILCGSNSQAHCEQA